MVRRENEEAFILKEMSQPSCTPVILALALKKSRQEDCKFKVILGYIVRPCI